MSESTSLVTFNDRMKIATQLSRSGYFKKEKIGNATASIFSRIQAGAELGLPPFASVAGIYMQNEKPCMLAGLMSVLVRQSGRYDYRVEELTNTKCVLAFYKTYRYYEPGANDKLGELLGKSEFTWDDAVRAELHTGFNKHSWLHYPRNMLFARAMSNGIKWYCPDCMGGTAWYVPEEVGVKVDSEGGPIIDADLCINNDKVLQLTGLISSTEANEEKILGFYGVKSLKELNESDYEDLIGKLSIKPGLKEKVKKNVSETESTAGALQVQDSEVGISEDGKEG